MVDGVSGESQDEKESSITSIDPRRMATPTGVALTFAVVVASTLASTVGLVCGLLAIEQFLSPGWSDGFPIVFLSIAAILLLGGLVGFGYLLKLLLMDSPKVEKPE